MNPSWLRPLASVLLLLAAPGAALAQRTLRWENVAVAAHLDRNGQLQVDEVQTMVFTGDWNGGERTFTVRRGQFSFTSLSRFRDGGFRPMVADPKLDDDRRLFVGRDTAAVAQPPGVRSAIRRQLLTLPDEVRAVGHPGEGGRPLPARS